MTVFGYEESTLIFSCVGRSFGKANLIRLEVRCPVLVPGKISRREQERPVAEPYITQNRKNREDHAMTYNPKRALELLRTGSGRVDATFRGGQEDAIRHIVEGRGRLLVVQKTGWGKSFVYFIATKLLRDNGNGPALLISPLLALMRNQIAAAERMGVRAATLNSDNFSSWTQVEAKLARGEIDILLISPERLANERFRTQVLAGIAAQISMLVIDEAHCISD